MSRSSQVGEEVFSIFARADKPLGEIVKENAEKLFGRNSHLEQYVESIARRIKRAQLRKFYSYIRSLQNQWKEKKGALSAEDKLKLLKINMYLAYAVGRKYVPRNTLDKLFALMVERVKTYEDFRVLVDIFEAIIAYHVYHSAGR